MKKTIIIFSFILNIVFIILSIVVILNYNDILVEYLKKLANYLKEFSGVITAVVALLNIFFLLWFRSIDGDNKRKAEKHARKSFWFRDVILSRNFGNLETFDELISRLDLIDPDNRDEKDMSDLINSFQNNKRILGHSLFDALRMIDINVSEILQLKLDDLEDFFTEQIEEIFTCLSEQVSLKRDELKMKYTTYNNELYEMLFEFEMRGYSSRAMKTGRKTRNKNKGHFLKFNYSIKKTTDI